MTENLRPTLERIIRNNETMGNLPGQRVLMLYDEDLPFLGDTCLRFGKLGHLRSCLNSSRIHLNFQPAKKYTFGPAILKDNPHLDHFSVLEWKDIDLSQYGIIFIISYTETAFLQYLHDHYAGRIGNGDFTPAIFSLSKRLLWPRTDPDFIFPEHRELMEDMQTPLPIELYISDAERDRADQWLLSKGVETGDELFICCDSTTDRNKLLNIVVYFEFLEFLLGKSRSKLLIFDEKGIGKAEFYRNWLGDRAKDRLIVSEGPSLRENISLLAARSTRLIFGPCTGLMHCASGIYNHYVNQGMALSSVPLIITYTGLYKEENNSANEWWCNSPLVQCLLLKNVDGKKRIRLLTELPLAERALNDSLPCSEYTTRMLTDFVNARYASKPMSPAGVEDGY